MPFSFWDFVGKNAAIITILTLLAGVFLTAGSFALQIHDLKFDGYISGQQVDGFPQKPAGYTKQVGYAWAPNWSITGVLLLPLALFNLFLAIRTIETLLRDIVVSGMLRHRDFSAVDADEVIMQWRRQARPWALIGLGVAVVSGLYIALFDFWPVVLDWLLMDASERYLQLFGPEARVKFVHPQYEFDWSIAATFDVASVGTTSNAVFSFMAYLIIAILGMSVVFGAFIFLCAFCAFFSETMRHDLDLVLVPDITSGDPRCGFERFESFFHHLILAAVLTGAMAVAMHLQNVFLRSPSHETIVDMEFPRFRGHPLTEVERCSDAENEEPVPCGIQGADRRASPSGSKHWGVGPGV